MRGRVARKVERVSRMGDNFHVTLALHEWDLIDSRTDLDLLARSGVTRITFPVVWKHVEHVRGEFDFRRYDDLLKPILMRGFSLVILLDAGGRWDFDSEGNAIFGVIGYPDWFLKGEQHFALDFQGTVTTQVSFVNDEAISAIERFYDAAVPHFAELASHQLHGIAVGLQMEFEIKYGQNGYVWRDYSNSAIGHFKAASGFDPPVLNYGRSIVAAQSECPGFCEWMEFREQTLAAAVARLSSVIRRHGQKAIGYFGEFFNSHDGIYALGIVGDLVPYLDVVVLDFNFFNGWDLDPDPWKVPLMANFAKTIGYKAVLGGYYVERWRQPVNQPGAPTDPTVFSLIGQSIREARERDLIDGAEIGGFGDITRDVGRLRAPDLDAVLSEGDFRSNKRPERDPFHIGLVGSHATFNWFIGEHAFGRNIHADALVRSFELFSKQTDIDCRVLSEKTLRHNKDILNDLDAIYVPHQPVIADDLRRLLTGYANSDRGLLIQDMRFGEWTGNGGFSGGWSNELFGITGIVGRNGGMFTYRGSQLRMPEQTRQYVSHAQLLGSPGTEVLIPAVEGHGGLFLLNLNCVTLGFIPAILEGAGASRWAEIFIMELRSILTARRSQRLMTSAPVCR
jgi:hypothetical protein